MANMGAGAWYGSDKDGAVELRLGTGVAAMGEGVGRRWCSRWWLAAFGV